VVKKVRHPNLISLQAFWMKDADGQIVDEAGDALRNTVEVSTPAADPKRQTQTNIAMTANFARPVELIIAMQLGSMSLHRRLEECREQGMAGVPVAELLEYLEQSARGIDFLNKPIHDLGKGPMPIVHGDIKPHNILVVGDAAVVCDFGLARAVETLRKTSMAPVTVAYAAPESFKGKVTPTSDQYSLAITYVELRTGRLPFDETMTPYQVMEAHVLRSLDFSRLPEPERVVIQRATESTPEDRWPSSRDLILALRHAVAQTGELPLRPGEGPYLGGPTPSHSLTARPRPQDTGMPTRIGVDPHKDTMHPGGRTPALGLSHQTEPSPAGFRSPADPLAETSMLGAGGLVAKKSNKTAAILMGLTAAVVVVLGAVFLPKILHPNPTGGVVKPNDNGEPASDDPNVVYIRLVQSKINGDEFEAAIKLLEKAPNKLPEFEKDDLQKKLHTKYLSFVDSRMQSGSYSRALGDLEDAPTGVGLTDEDRKQAREKVRAGWLAQAQEELQNDNFKAAKDTAGGLLKRFDGDRDAQFVVARSDVRSSDYAGALAVLEKIGKTSDLPKEYQPLDAGLSLLAIGSNSATPADPVKLLDGFLELLDMEKKVSPPAGLAISEWERNRLERLRKEVGANVETMLKTLPPDQAKALAAKLELLGASTGVELFKVKSAIAAKQFDEARKILKGVVDKLPADADGPRMEAAAIGLLIDLRDPATKPDDAAKALDDALKRVDKLTPAMRGELCAAAEALALGSPAAMLEPGLALVNRAHNLDPGDSNTSQQLARLLAKRLEIRSAQSNLPSREELTKLVQDCETVEAAKLGNNPTIDAFYAECLMLQDSRDRQRIVALVERAEPADGYVKFVKSRVQRLSPEPDWARIAQLLTEVYGGDPAGLSPAVTAPFRREVAARLLADAAMKKRIAVNTADASSAFENPFGKDKKNADQAFELLSLSARVGLGASAKSGGTLEPFKMVDLATAISKEAESGAKDAGQRDRWINLALAAGYKTQPDDKLTRSLMPALTKLSNADLGNDAIPLLLGAFRAEKGSAADQPAAVMAAERLMELFQKQYPVADTQAVELYKDVIVPALGMADAQSGAKSPPADLDKFYAAVAELIGHYQRASWPFGDKQPEIEKLLTKAIKLNPKVAKYYTSRGVARISQTPPNVDGALADAAEASKIDPNFPAAYALQGHALIYRSRQQPTAAQRLTDLEAALAKCRAAVDTGKPTDDAHAMHLLYLSMALLEKANFTIEPKLRKELLEEAIANAQKAVDLEKAYPDYANTELGDALEDMAWLVGDEPEKNYLAAIDAFSRANESNPSSPDPLIGRARCYYRALADSKLDPKFLNRTNEQVMQAAIADLQAALQLRPDLAEPNLWLGKADQQLNKYDDADAALGTAVKLAEEQKAPARATYLLEWARNALLNPSLSAEDKAKTVRERAEKLKTAPSLGGYSTAKQAALLIGEILMADKKFAEALKEYDAALADYDKADPTKPLDPTKADGSDVSLLLARAACRFSMPTSEWNLTAAEGVVKDTARVAQLKPGPRFEALAAWYSANAKSKSGLNSSPTFTQEKKDAFRLGAIDDYRKAIDLAQADPNTALGSWQWRESAAKMLALNVRLALATTPPETLKKWAAEARGWINDAVNQVSKRPDLSDKLQGVQRTQQDVENTLTAKKL
jgi:serine/threonine protein kinase